jgi:hypothetical protein
MGLQERRAVPRIVRPMLKDQSDGLPQVGTRSKCLGVRPSGRYRDVEIEEDGTIRLNHQGMSVSKTWKGLPAHLVPSHLDNGENGASGEGMEVYVHGNGTGDFAEEAVAEGLCLWFKPETRVAGNVCPDAAIQLTQYLSNLVDTRTGWEVDETV